MEYKMPILGDFFPEMKVNTTHGEMHLPNDLTGQWFILFSHPADFTPVCTTEFISFQNVETELQKMNTQLIGLSIDQIFSHMKWTEWIKEKLDVKINFPIIAANDRIANKLGMLHEDKGTNTVRAVFIIDPEGIIRLIMFYPQEIGRNINEIVRSLQALQTSDNKKIACPANWPSNELIGDKVIIPPPQNEKDAEKRLMKYQGYDWWFCFKKL